MRKILYLLLLLNIINNVNAETYTAKATYTLASIYNSYADPSPTASSSASDACAKGQSLSPPSGTYLYTLRPKVLSVMYGM